MWEVSHHNYKLTSDAHTLLADSMELAVQYKHSCVGHVSHHHDMLKSDACTQLADLMERTVQYRAVVVCCTLTLDAYTLLDSIELSSVHSNSLRCDTPSCHTDIRCLHSACGWDGTCSSIQSIVVWDMCHTTMTC